MNRPEKGDLTSSEIRVGRARDAVARRKNGVGSNAQRVRLRGRRMATCSLDVAGLSRGVGDK